MPVVSDFTLIQKDAFDLGDNGEQIFKRRFHTGGRTSDPALIMLMVRGLTLAGDVRVRVNNRAIGVIQSHPRTSSLYWYTQIIPFEGGVLNNGFNEIEILATPNPTGTDTFDDFRIQSVVCFFHQRA